VDRLPCRQGPKRCFGTRSPLVLKAASERLIFEFGQGFVVDHHFTPIPPKIELAFPERIKESRFLLGIRVPQRAWYRREQPRVARQSG
jgi:hypothetical protein